MPPVTGNYSKGTLGGFLEQQRLALALLQKGVPVIDADFIRNNQINYTLIRRALGVLIGNASPNSGFLVVGDSSANDVQISGGNGTVNGAGRMWVEGNQCMLLSDIRFVNNGTTDDELSIYPTISFIVGVGNITIQDTSANYVPGALVGLTITPDVTQPGTTATIVSNTATDITVGIDLIAAGIAVGARYRIEMDTPSGAGRNDGVYLNVHLDEIDSTDLPDIRHDFGTQITTSHFLGVRQKIEIVRGDSVGLPGSPPAFQYVDADGFEHFLVKIADITRFDGVATIAPGDVSDLRFTAGNFTNFLVKTGDNMTGDLNMVGADIVMDPTQTVDGRDVSVDGAKLDTIDFTGSGVAALLPKVVRQVKAEFDLTGVAAAQLVVGQSFRSKDPGGDDSTKGVNTVAPNNTVRVQRVNTNDDILGGTDSASKVFGRLTENHPTPNISGTWTFTNASLSIVGVGGSANTELVPGDLVLGPDSVWYTVDVIGGPNNVTLVEPFAGTTGPVANPSARRWLLDFVVNDAGTESGLTPAGTPDIKYFFTETFDYSDVPPRDPIEEDQVAANVPTASEAVAGKVQLSPDGGTTAGQAVQASDTRLEGVAAEQNDAGTTARRGIMNFEGTAIASVAQEATKNTITINQRGAPSAAEVLAALASAAGPVDINNQRLVNAADPDPGAAGLQHAVTRNFLENVLGVIRPTVCYYRNPAFVGATVEWTKTSDPDSIFPAPLAGGGIRVPSNGWWEVHYTGSANATAGTVNMFGRLNGVEQAKITLGADAGPFPDQAPAALTFLVQITSFGTDAITITGSPTASANDHQLYIKKVRNL